MMRTLLLVLFAFPAVGQMTLTGKSLPVPEGQKNMLFYLQRTKNTNTVIYEAKLDDKGELARNQPVDAYWMDYEQGEDVRNDLSYLERMSVYGVDMEDLKDGKGSYLMRLKAFKKRAVTVAKDKLGKYVGMMSINGKKAILQRIYIEAKEGLITPTVVHVDLFGTDPVTGERVFERIFP